MEAKDLNHKLVFEQTDFNKKHKSISLKPFNFACILKLSKAQLTEKAFRDGLIDQLYELLLEQFHIHSHSVGFPELALPAVLQLRDFLKKCKVANYCKQIKQIIEKVEDNSKYITNRRRSATFLLADVKALESWERQCKDSGTPIGKYYKTWRKLRDQELQHEIAGKEQIVGLDDNIPVIQRPKGPLKATPKERDEFADLFKSDSEESDDETRFLPKSERPAKKQKTSHGETSFDDQEYSDFDSDELEILARSGDEESDDDEDEDDDEKDDDNTDDADEDDSNSDDVENNDEDDMNEEDDDDVVEDFHMSDSD